MKRRKDDEKIMGPLFPRLHVNDTEKGGPRAPPRNKMALYEQLTIPSQRYSNGVGTLKQNNGCSNLVPSASTSQGNSHERNTYSPLYRPPLASAHNDIQVRNTEAVSLSKQQNQAHNKKRALEEDDFRVPIFSQPVAELQDGRTLNSSNEKCSHLSLHRQTLLSETGDEETKRSMPQQPTNDGDGRNLRVSYAPSKKFSDILMSLTLNPQASCGYKGDDEINIELARREGDQSPEKGSLDRGDDSSETSTVDSATGFDTTPDDVVEIIGLKDFWKARSAIANQQRVFAIQVFELHRLIKVQKLIAESPNLLLEGTAFVSKSSLKDSAVKKYSSEFAVKALPHKGTQKDEPHKATDKVEGTAENAVPKASPLVRSQQNPVQPAGYQAVSVNTASSPPVSMNPWGFHQPAAHQWLVPVMSPTEGLVYKPYPVPGFMDPIGGGSGPVGPTPGNLMHPAFGVQTSQHQHGMAMPPDVHFGGHGYFPPYGMPVISPSISGSTVEQLNQFSGPNRYSQVGHPPGVGVNLSAQHQSSLSTPSQENGANAPAARSLPRREGKLHGSTGSSPSDRVGMTHLSEGRDALPLSVAPPTAGVSEEAPSQEKRARVIRVVPHRSTRESAARIFQSIQEERKQFDSSSVS